MRISQVTSDDKQVIRLTNQPISHSLIWTTASSCAITNDTYQHSGMSASLTRLDSCPGPLGAGCDSSGSLGCLRWAWRCWACRWWGCTSGCGRWLCWRSGRGRRWPDTQEKKTRKDEMEKQPSDALLPLIPLRHATKLPTGQLKGKTSLLGF